MLSKRGCYGKRLAQSKSFIEDKEAGLASRSSQKIWNLLQEVKDSVWPLRVRKPGILIFDDSFSALDYKTDRVLRQELAENKSISSS